MNLFFSDVKGFFNFKNKRILLEQLTPYDIDHKKIRIGSDQDGGYVVADCNLDNVAALYSYGIAEEDLFDLQFSQNFEKPVFQYDPYVDRSPSALNNPLISFKKQGVSSVKDHQHDTLENHIIENGHTSNPLFLKMDIEGMEWEVLAAIPDSILQQFDQIVLELHGLEFFSKYSDYNRILKKINQHFVLFHVHGNNGLGKPTLSDIPCLLEVSFIHKKYVSQKSISKEASPSALDRPNCPNKPEIILDYWLK